MGKIKFLTKMYKLLQPSKRKYVEWRHLKGSNIFETFRNAWSYNTIALQAKRVPKKEPLLKRAQKLKSKAQKLAPGAKQATKEEKANTLIIKAEYYGKAQSLFKEAKAMQYGTVQREKVKLAQKAAAEAEFYGKVAAKKKITTLDILRADFPAIGNFEYATGKTLSQAGIGIACNWQDIQDAKKELGTGAMLEEVAKSGLITLTACKGLKFSQKLGKTFGTTVGIYKPHLGTAVQIGTVGATIFGVGTTCKTVLNDSWVTQYEKTKTSRA